MVIATIIIIIIINCPIDERTEMSSENTRAWGCGRRSVGHYIGTKRLSTVLSASAYI